MFENIVLSGWGRTHASSGLITAEPPNRILDQARCHNGITMRGSGCSYGDASTAAGAIVCESRKLLGLELSGGLLVAGAGETITSMQRYLDANDLSFPVIPGTGRVTLGGAIAADVHGKNHHSVGSLGHHVAWIELLCGDGSTRVISDTYMPDLFWGTIGGMGLTGAILRAAIRPSQEVVRSVLGSETRHSSIESIMDAMQEADTEFDYTIAWIDMSRGQRERTQQTRGILISANTSPDPMSSSGHIWGEPSRVKPSRVIPAMNPPRWTIRAANEFTYRTRSTQTRRIRPQAFFHPLDKIEDWNMLLGRRGFVEYQFCVPEVEPGFIAEFLRWLRAKRLTIPIAGIKRFGAGNPGLLSFPRDGWTLSFDILAHDPRLPEILNDLDDFVVSLSGRVYLAKDSRLTAETFRQMYDNLDHFQVVRRTSDPAGLFSSDLAKRLALD